MPRKPKAQLQSPRLFQRGDWIATTGGMLGMIIQCHPHRRSNYYFCKFGPDGPHYTLAYEDLRHATKEEIDYMEGQTAEIKRKDW